MLFFFFKQKTAYEMRISDWSSDVCSSDRRLVSKGARTTRDASPGRAARGPLLGGHARSDLADPILGFEDLRPRAGELLAMRARCRRSPKIGRASCRERGCKYV